MMTRDQLWATGLFDEQMHARLVDDTTYTRTAGLPHGLLGLRQEEHCPASEYEWTTAARRHAKNGRFGLIQLTEDDVLLRQQAMCARMLRALPGIDARIKTANAVVKDDFNNSNVRVCQVLLIPNLTDVTPTGKQAEVLSDVLNERAGRSLLTVVSFPSLERVCEYPFGRMMATSYDVVEDR